MDDEKPEGKLESYRGLLVYQKAYELTLRIFRATRRFPKEEMYGLVTQMRRSAASIPSNIAEGYSRHSRKEYLHFLSIAYGSAAELGTHISISHDMEYLDMSEYESIHAVKESVSRLLWKLIVSLKENS